MPIVSNLFEPRLKEIPTHTLLEPYYDVTFFRDILPG